MDAIPRLGTPNPHVRLGPEAGWIIEACGSDTDVPGPRRARSKQRRTAMRTELASCGVATFGHLLVGSRLASRNVHGVPRHDEGWRIGTAACNLAIAAMAIEHPHRDR